MPSQLLRASDTAETAHSKWPGRGPTRASLVLFGLTMTLLGLTMTLFAFALSGCSSEPAGTRLFDDSTVHAVDVSFATEDYEAMIEAYKDSGQKEWIEATVTIDGDTYERVGMRLKGNSSIGGLRNGFRMAGPGAGVSADAPEGLPWLIRLDKNIEGQDHDGIADLVVRSNVTETSLNEAVSLELLGLAGLATQDGVATRFTVNGGEPALRLVTEHPDDIWMAERFDDGGALYKAESTGDYSYRGPDPESYAEVFDQEAGKDNTDLTPLIAFLDFVNNSDDATFNAELAQHVDIASLATYLAAEELLDNFDDIDGPGNNSYLYYDIHTDTFTVVPWDHNLAFGALGEGAGPQGNGAGGRTPAPGQNPAGRQPAGQTPAAGQAPGADGGALRGFPGRLRSNVLVERFHANPEFEALYEAKLEELRGTLYRSGAAAQILERWVAVLESQASDLVSATTVQDEAAAIAAHFEK